MSEERKEYKIDGRPATIFRSVKNKENPYVMIDRRPVDNNKLSFKSKGILTYLMSRPDGWEVSVADLIKHSTDGEASVRSGLKELRDAGHMRYIKSRNQGRITGWIIEVYELPQGFSLTEDIPSDDAIDEKIPPDSENRDVVTPTGGGSPDSDFLDVEKQDVENQQIENRTQVLSTLSTNDFNEYSTKEPVLNQELHFTIWEIIKGEFAGDRTMPIQTRAKVANTQGVRMDGDRLIVASTSRDCDWLNGHVKRVAERMLPGISARVSEVEFVAS